MYIKEIIEYLFSFCLFINAALFIPQSIKIIKTKSSQNLSLMTFIGFNLIQFFTILHGVIMSDYLLVAGYSLSLVTCGAVTILILLYKKDKDE